MFKIAGKSSFKGKNRVLGFLAKSSFPRNAQKKSWYTRWYVFSFRLYKNPTAVSLAILLCGLGQKYLWIILIDENTIVTILLGWKENYLQWRPIELRAIHKYMRAAYFFFFYPPKKEDGQVCSCHSYESFSILYHTYCINQRCSSRLIARALKQLLV